MTSLTLIIVILGSRTSTYEFWDTSIHNSGKTYLIPPGMKRNLSLFSSIVFLLQCWWKTLSDLCTWSKVPCSRPGDWIFPMWRFFFFPFTLYNYWPTLPLKIGFWQLIYNWFLLSSFQCCNLTSCYKLLFKRHCAYALKST